MADAENNVVMAPATGRGVAYPAFSLQEALARARKFWDAEKKNAAPVSAAVGHWGYGGKSSGGKRTIAALIQYGLMTDAGADEKRTVKLSDRALTIVLSEPGSEVWLKAVREAALSPKIYAELLNKWPASELPSDTTLQFYLVKDRNFNTGTVADFIKDFRATVNFAKLDEAGAEQPAAPDARAQVGEPVNAQPAPIAAALASTARGTTPPAGIKQDVFSLDEGQVVLMWPAKMSPESYQDFKDWIELQVRKIARAVEAAPPSPPSSVA